MAGTINLALTQQFDMNGDPLAGGKLYFFAAGTTTPQNAFQDVALTIPQPNPIILDASGRVPMFYLADGNIKIRLADISDVTIIAADQLLVIGPSVPAAAIPPPPAVGTTLATGDIKARYGIGTLAGFVRCNGGSIGKTGTAATERPNDDTSDLFQYLWTFANITLNGPKTTAPNDFATGKLLNLPDLRGRVIAGMDDMGAAAAGRLTSTYFGAGAVNPSGNTNGITLGNAGGDEKKTLAIADLPAHVHPVNSAGSMAVSVEDADHRHTVIGDTNTESATHTHNIQPPVLPSGGLTGGTAGTTLGALGNATTLTENQTHTHPVNLLTGFISNTHRHNITGTTELAGGAGTHSVASPMMVLTYYIKL